MLLEACTPVSKQQQRYILHILCEEPFEPCLVNFDATGKFTYVLPEKDIYANSSLVKFEGVIRYPTQSEPCLHLYSLCNPPPGNA